MINKYFKILEQLEFKDKSFLNFKEKLVTYDFKKSSEETFSWITCVLALQAASKDNLGVGAILVRDHSIIQEACNEMLNPYFRSDGHPEMLVLSEYEKNNKIMPGSMNTLVMYSSLEPCPMCLTRISTTGIKLVKYIAPHPGSGMANHIDKLPVLWQIFCEDLKIVESDCSQELKELSSAILNLTAKIQVPKILTYKEGDFPKIRMENYILKLNP